MRRTATPLSGALSALLRRWGRRCGERPRASWFLRRGLRRVRRSAGTSGCRLLLRFARRQRLRRRLHVVSDTALGSELPVITKFYLVMRAFPARAHPQLRCHRANIFLTAYFL